MNKALEALKRIKQFIKPTQAVIKYDNGEQQSFYSHTLGELFPKEFDTIEITLKDHEELIQKYNELLYNYQELVHCGLKSEQKKIKAFDIIKRNPLMVCTDFYKCIVELKLTYQEYLEYLPTEEDRAIKTQEEYDLLKEVLK